MKTIAAFVQLTSGADVKLCRMVALRAVLASTAIVLGLAIFGPIILTNWGVSFDAVALTSGIILFLLPLQVIMPSPTSSDQGGTAPETLSNSVIISRLVIPTIVTPPGIAAILALAVVSLGDLPQWLTILGFASPGDAPESVDHALSPETGRLFDGCRIACDWLDLCRPPSFDWDPDHYQ